MQSVQRALQRNRLFLTQVCTVTGHFLKTMVSYPPSTLHLRKALFNKSEKIQHTPPFGTQYSKKSADTGKTSVSSQIAFLCKMVLRLTW